MVWIRDRPGNRGRVAGQRGTEVARLAAADKGGFKLDPLQDPGRLPLGEFERILPCSEAQDRVREVGQGAESTGALVDLRGGGSLACASLLYFCSWSSTSFGLLTACCISLLLLSPKPL